MSQAEFKKLSLLERLKYVKSNGQYLATRQYASFNVHLYLIEDFFIEAWMKQTFNELAWIELTTQELIAQNYLNSDDILAELDL